MPLFIQKIPHLLFGVSQRPNVQKDPSHLQSCDNWIARAAYGLAKRPPFAFLGKLTSTLTGIAGASIFSIQRDDDDRYRVVIQDGTIKAYDMVNGGTSTTIEDRTSDTYLDDAGGAGFRHVTIGDATYVTNRGVEVTKGLGRATTPDKYAIVTIEQADFSTVYTVIFNGTTYTVTTVDQGDATSRGQINTDQICSDLYDEMTSGFQNIFTGALYDTTLLGSSIHIRCRLSFIDFSIDTWDGLGDKGIRLIKGEIKDAEDLVFSRAPHGTKVKVTGDAGTEKDDFWMIYDATGFDPDESSSKGVWKETIAPGAALKLDKETMPHKLGWKTSMIEGAHEVEQLPPMPTMSDYIASTASGGWTEDQAGAAVTEEDDDIIIANRLGRRRLVPGADGSTRQLMAVRYDIDTSNVQYGVDTIVNIIHRTTGGTETTLKRIRYQPGETRIAQKQYIISDSASEGDWLATDRIKIELEYGDDIEPTSGQEAILTFLGGAVGTKADLTPRYIPIEVKNYGGISITFNGTTYREGTIVSVTLAYTDIVDEFSYTVPAGGKTAAQVCAAISSLMDTTGVTDYTSSVTSGSTLRVYVTAKPSADPSYSASSISYAPGKCALDLTLTTNEFVGETVRNLTDGSEGTITANTDDGLFTATLSGGDDNLYIPGDRIEIVGTGGYFVWETITWDERRVGDEDTNPWPSFKDTTVRDVFFYRNRLGMVSGRGVVMSESGDFHNFFRNTIQQLLDGDVIDISSAHGDVAIFHSAVVWGRTLYLWTENAQYELYGEPILSPRTVRLDVVSRYFNTPAVRPQVLGPRLYFAHSQVGSGKIMEWLPPTDDLTQFLARDLTVDVPTYLPGQVVDIAGDYAHGMIAVIMDGDQDAIYVWSFTPDGKGGNIHESWQRWTLPAGSTARNVDFADGKLAVIYSYTDGVYVDEADMDQTIEGSTQGFIDRRVSSGDSGVSAVSNAGVDPLSLNPEFQFMFEEDQSPYGGTPPKVIDGWLDAVAESGHDLTQSADNEGFKLGTGGPVQDQYAEIDSVAVLEDEDSGALDLTTDFTAFAVIRVPVIGNENGHPIFSIFDLNDTGLSAGEFNWYVVGNDESTYNTGEVVFTRPYVEDAAIVGTPTLLTSNVWVVLSIRMTSRDCRIYINNVECTRQTFTSDGTTKPTLRLGAFRSNFFTMHANMDMAFVNAYDSSLTTQQMADVYAYLYDRYVVASGGDTTDITFPYPVAVDETEGEVRVWDKDTGAEITRDTETPRPTTTTVRVAGDESATSFDVGIAFEARARLAPLYFRDGQRTAETGGRTQIRELQVYFNNTEQLKVEVTPLGRSKYTHTVSNTSPTEGAKRVPVLSRGETTVIELVSDEAGDARVNAIDVELQHSNRSRRA